MVFLAGFAIGALVVVVGVLIGDTLSKPHRSDPRWPG